MLNLINLPSCFLIRIILKKSDEVIINDFYLEKWNDIFLIKKY